MTRGAGPMRERLTILTSAPVALLLASLTRVGSVATATTPAAHGYATGDYVTIAGANEAGYNAKVKITVTSPTAYTFAVSGSPATPASGKITSTYVSDALGGRRTVWSELATISAEMIPLRAS